MDKKDDSKLMLTKEEVSEIEKEVSERPILKNQKVFLTGTGYKAIVRVSPIHYIIFVNGNEHFGFEHIHTRHEFWSIRNDEIDPGRFSRSSIPFYDYTDIADSVYSESNKTTQGNKEPELFDLYIGKRKEKDGSERQYKLLLYKDSRVVHTLYPKNQSNNLKKQKGLPYRRGTVELEDHANKGVLVVRIPYVDKNDRVNYTIIIEKRFEKREEEALILIHDENEKVSHFVQLGKVDGVQFKSKVHELHKWQYKDLRAFEQKILQIEAQREA